MNIVYVSEQDVSGKIPDELISYRSDFALIKMLDAFHVPYSDAVPNINNKFYSVLDTADIIFFVPSKNYPETLNPILSWKKLGKRVGLLQEGPKTHWQNWSTQYQIQYIGLLKIVDIIICHNEKDKEYFTNFTKKPIIVSRTVQDINYWLEKKISPNEKNESVFVGGNMCEWYGGMHSYFVASKPEITQITIPSMGRKTPDEEEVLQKIDKRVRYLEYMDWANFMLILTQHKYAIHMMPLSAAGSFSMNCASLGIPCIGNRDNDTQRILFPDLSVASDDIQKATQLINRLISDKKFYSMVVKKALKNIIRFDINHNRDGIIKQITEVIKNGKII